MPDGPPGGSGRSFAGGPHPELNVVAADRMRDRLDGPVRVERGRHTLAAIGLGVSAQRLWWQLGRAARGPGALTRDEFFYYRLYDPALAAQERRRFVGKAVQVRMHRACNDPRWLAPVHDKALFYTVMRGLGLPIPETVAAFEKTGRTFFWPSLRHEDELRAVLMSPRSYPLFAKPIDGIYSIGALELVGVEGETVRMKGDARASVDEVIQFIVAFGRHGYLFQKRLAPHPALAERFGPTLGSIRLLVLEGPGGATVESAVAKIPRPCNVADNYWRPGNMVASLDLQLGAIRRVVSGVGEDMVTHEEHPDTNGDLIGFILPLWDQAVRLCLAGAKAFPGVRTQSWDVALTPSGPVLLEVNFGGDLNLHQLAHRRGALSDSFAAHLKRCGYRER